MTPAPFKWLWLACTATSVAILLSGSPLRTPDQKGHELYSNSAYIESADTFADSYWRAIALYRAGNFKEAAGIFAGYDTAEGCFNHGNALLFQGNYNEAAKRYERALEHRPNWEAAQTNRAIALARAEAGCVIKLTTEGDAGAISVPQFSRQFNKFNAN